MQEPLLPDTVYHIYNHANGSENLFRSEENYHYFLRKYGGYIYPVAETFAYCLMPNHFHLMVKIRTEEEVLNNLKELKATLQGFETLGGFSIAVSKQFSHFFNGYTQAYNKMYNRKGSLFMPNFKRKAISDNNYFTQLIAYIHLNPVKHGFCTNLYDWPHSSIHAYLHNKPSKLNREYLTEWFGDKNRLLEFHQNLRIEELSLI
jgi:REP element-mobilizing transposase RayT